MCPLILSSLYCLFIHQDLTDVNQGHNIIVRALRSTTILPVEHVPLTYLGIISNNWESVLASGGFGTVYKGVDMNANLEVAIKTLRSDRMSEKDKLDFEEEMMVGYPVKVDDSSCQSSHH